MRLTRIVVVLALAVAFPGGIWWAQRSRAAGMSAMAAVDYTCPMHPEYHSDHPGTCPICAMSLVEVRAEGARAGDAAAPAPPPAAVQVSPERQQAIGIRLGVATQLAGTQTLRTTGRVAADENRTYPIVAAVSGWIRTVGTAATGDAVTERQELARFLAPQPEFDTAQQMYYTALEMLYLDASAQPAAASRSQPHDAASASAGIERAADGLRILGVSDQQLREMGRRRELVQDIRIESPVDGFVLKRNVSPGLRFDRGFEFYRIADLDRVWILADLNRDQLPLVHRGASARITTSDGSQVLSATVSAAEPTFDEEALTSKLRLEAANPRSALKPGMFVDVEFAVDLPPALVVPADAVVDSGRRKTVFVDKGNGYFEPRAVETGRRTGDAVEVTKGLAAGERIVIAGTFFVDSESRMKAPVRAAASAKVVDPVCGMSIDPADAFASTAHRGHLLHFCSESCKRQFDADPSRYVKHPAGQS